MHAQTYRQMDGLDALSQSVAWPTSLQHMHASLHGSMCLADSQHAAQECACSLLTLADIEISGSCVQLCSQYAEQHTVKYTSVARRQFTGARVSAWHLPELVGMWVMAMRVGLWAPSDTMLSRA